MVDVLRCLGACCIIWFHAHAPGWQWAYGALTFFLIMTVVLPLIRGRSTEPGPFLMNRARRLLVPFLFWSAIYAAVRVGLGLLSDQPIADFFRPWMFFAGTSMHLWFLPYAFVMGGLAFVAMPWLRRLGMAGFAGTLALSILLMPTSAWYLSVPRDIPFAQWMGGAPAIGFAVAIALVGQERWRWIAVLAGGLAGMALCYGVVGNLFEAMPVVVGLVAVVLGLLLPFPSIMLLRQMADRTLTVYASHILFLSVMQRVLAPEHSALMAIATIVLSFALAMVLEQVRLARAKQSGVKSPPAPPLRSHPPLPQGSVHPHTRP